MREIKFRAWDGESMRFFDLLDKKKNDWNVENFMQYTGLKDKNGKEIYEGDIVRSLRKSIMYKSEGNRYKVVSWNENTNGFNIRKNKGSNNYEKWEVIGNIWENPEAFKGGVFNGEKISKADKG